MGDSLSEIFEVPENLFSVLETLEAVDGDSLSFSMYEEEEQGTAGIASQNSNFFTVGKRDEADEAGEEEAEEGGKKKKKKIKLTGGEARAMHEGQDGQTKISHIAVERNRRKQMNEHLVVLKSLMPCFYVKRGDQASIIGGVVEYIKELQQLLGSLEAKKQRRVVLGGPVLSPRAAPLCSPRPPLSPRVAISPRTPQQGSPYSPNKTQLSHIVNAYEPSSLLLETNGTSELAGTNYRSGNVADVEVKFSGPNLVMKTVSQRIPGQALKIIAVLEGLPLEILHVSISTVEDTLMFSFTIKIGVECELSAEELANEIQQTFS